MRIIQIIYALGSGGAEKFVVNLSNELIAKGNEVIVIQLLDNSKENRNFNQQFLHKDVQYINAGFTPGFSIAKVRKVCKIIKEINPDVVHCHLNVIPYIFPLALKRGGVKFVHTLHNIAQKACGSIFQKPINKWFYKTGRIIPVTISDECKESYKCFYGLPNVTRINNGTSELKASEMLNSVKTEIETYKRTSFTKVLVHAARCSEQKNQMLLINSINRLVSEGKDIVLLILGSHYDSKEGKELKERACENIHFLGLKSNVGDYMLCADAFCLSSSYEGLPISLLEALSAGLTPVCTPVGGIPDVVTDGITGYLSKDLSEESYVEVLTRFIEKPIDKYMLKEQYNKFYSMHFCAEEYIKLYKAIIS